MVDFSVLMSIYKREKPEWFIESIESILLQTWKPKEIILIKDGSLTNVLDEIIENYNIKYPNLFNVVALKKNVGLGLALAEGIKACNYELIARMDTDDISLPERFEKQLSIMDKNKYIDIIGSNVNEFNESIHTILTFRKVPEKHTDIIKFSKRRCPFIHQTVIFKKSKVLNSGNYRDYLLCEDYDLFVRMIKNDAHCYNVQEPLVLVRINESLYKRRGGYKYLEKILSFKYELFKTRYISFIDWINVSIIHTLVIMMPNSIRKRVYKNLLRKPLRKSINKN